VYVIDYSQKTMCSGFHDLNKLWEIPDNIPNAIHARAIDTMED